MKYLESQLDNYFEWEMKVLLLLKVQCLTTLFQAVRGSTDDRRVDVCLYLLPPTGHGIKKVDLEFLKRIQVTKYLNRYKF